MSQFLFLKYNITKGLHVLNIVWWIFDKKKLNFQFFLKTNISLISFQQLDLNGNDPWNLRVDFETKSHWSSL